jgi:hypothetical protein
MNASPVAGAVLDVGIVYDDGCAVRDVPLCGVSAP